MSVNFLSVLLSGDATIPDIHYVVGPSLASPLNSTHHLIPLPISTHHPIPQPLSLTTTHDPPHPPIIPHSLTSTVPPPTHYDTNPYPTPYISSPVEGVSLAATSQEVWRMTAGLNGESLTASRGGGWRLGGERRVWPPAVWARIGDETSFKSWKFMTRDGDDAGKKVEKTQRWRVDKTTWRVDKNMTRA